MPKYDLVLLDLDGTLADTDELIVQTMNILYDKYRDGKRTPREEIYYFSGPPIGETLKKEFPDTDVELLMKEFASISWDLYASIVSTYPHALEVLTKLKDEGIHLGVVTSKMHITSVYCLENLKLGNIIEYICAFDDVKNPKPHEEGILQSMSDMGISDKRKVLYIGDNTSDYLCAKNAGVDVAMVTWGPREIDKSIKPTYWLNDYLELEDIVHGKDL